MRSKSKSPNPASFQLHPWLFSAGAHFFLFLAALSLYFGSGLRPHPEPLDITVIEAPKKSAATPILETVKPRERRKQAPVHNVFGVSRSALPSSSGIEVKSGNTLAKEPDREKLNPREESAPPTPTEEYLVTKMPVLVSDVHVPYPAGPRSRGVQGKVLMDLLIDPRGKVREVKLLEAPDPELGAAALNAARGFQFEPALIQDKPVAVRIRYSYRFVLER